jgi:hypothetical protein
MLRRRGDAVVRGTAGLVVALALAAAIHGSGTRVHDAWSRVTAPEASETALDLAPGASHGLSVDALVLARQTIPPTAKIAIVVGNAPPRCTETRDAGTRSARWLRAATKS